MAVSTIALKDIVVTNYTGLTASVGGGANTYTNTNIDISSAVPSGYQAFEVTIGATGDYRVDSYNCLLREDGKAQVQLRNSTSSAINVTPQFRVWCKRL